MLTVLLISVLVGHCKIWEIFNFLIREQAIIENVRDKKADTEKLKNFISEIIASTCD